MWILDQLPCFYQGVFFVASLVPLVTKFKPRSIATLAELKCRLIAVSHKHFVLLCPKKSQPTSRVARQAEAYLYTSGGDRHCERPGPGLETRPVDPEMSALTMRPPFVTWAFY